jgi:hypothetical protein
MRFEYESKIAEVVEEAGSSSKIIKREKTSKKCINFSLSEIIGVMFFLSHSVSPESFLWLLPFMLSIF